MNLPVFGTLCLLCTGDGFVSALGNLWIRCLTSNPTLKVQIQLTDTQDIVYCCESSMCPTTPLIVPASHQRLNP